MDLATIIGLVLAWGAFFGSIIMEGGELKAMINPSAALLVFGGTLGATMISFPPVRRHRAARCGQDTLSSAKKEDCRACDPDAGRLCRKSPARGPAGAGR